MSISVSTGLLLISLGATPAMAEPTGDPGSRPDRDDLRFYVFCSDLAMQRPLAFEEAATCEQAYDRVKLSFVPGVSFEDFKALPTRDRAAVNLVGYKRFRDWYDANSAFIEEIREELRAGASPAGG